jgi:hypothetical protein
LIKPLIGLVLTVFIMLATPYPLVQIFMADGAFTRLLTRGTD